MVTGGLGAIGRAVCLKLAAEGATVYVAGRSINTISQIVDEIREMGKLAEPFVLDVMDEKLIEQRFYEIFSVQKKKLDNLSVVPEEAPEKGRVNWQNSQWKSSTIFWMLI